MSEPTNTSAWAETTSAALRSRGHRSGGARKAVTELLGRQHCCLTAQEVFDQLRGEGRRVGSASTYRTLEPLTLAGRGGCLDGVEHAVADDCVLEGGAEVRSLAVVASELGVRLGDVGAWGLRRRPPVLLWYG